MSSKAELAKGKKNKLILFGGIGLAVVAAVVLITMFASKSKKDEKDPKEGGEEEGDTDSDTFKVSNKIVACEAFTRSVDAIMLGTDRLSSVIEIGKAGTSCTITINPCTLNTTRGVTPAFVMPVCLRPVGNVFRVLKPDEFVGENTGDPVADTWLFRYYEPGEVATPATLALHYSPAGEDRKPTTGHFYPAPGNGTIKFIKPVSFSFTLRTALPPVLDA